MRRSISVLTLAALVLGTALGASDRDSDALERAWQLQMEFRQGNLQVTEPLVKGLEVAVAQSPDNAKMWEALGNAYMSRQGSLYASQADPAVLIDVGERARKAYGRALDLQA